MRAVELVFIIAWALFWLYWLVAAFSMKHGRVPWSRELGIRATIAVIVFVMVRSGVLRDKHLNRDVGLGVVGVILLFLGLAFAVWARRTIGRNWGSPMTQKDDPELVTSGPYRWVRHPIYSGILLAGIGTAIGLSWIWLTIVAIAGIYFIYSAMVEERFMTARFPDTYPAYRNSTKMLVPFLI